MLRPLGLDQQAFRGSLRTPRESRLKARMLGSSREMASNSSIRSKTDTQGRYISQGLQPGVYRVALVVNGAVKASITNTKTKADQATQLNFDLKPVAASQASAAGKSGKHKVWVPSNTGSHIGGSWVEVDDGARECRRFERQKRQRRSTAANN